MAEGGPQAPRGRMEDLSRWLLGADVHGSTAGHCGFGRIGQAWRAGGGFDMRVVFFDPTHPEARDPHTGAVKVDLEELLAQSDFLSLHAPLSGKNRGMFNMDAFGKMKSGAILINTARGGLVDQPALYDALKSRKLAAAALDVSDPEPLPADHPLLTLDNLLNTHIASARRFTREKKSLRREKRLADCAENRLPNC